MFIVIIITFVAGYTCIILGPLLHINKTTVSLLLAVLLWGFFLLGDWSSFSIYTDFLSVHSINPRINFPYWIITFHLVKKLREAFEILFFLFTTMSIVEIVNAYGGFSLITNQIHQVKKKKILWIIGLFTFFISAILDNLTTSIVMMSLLKTKIENKEDRCIFGSVVILAANAGGAWSPIGDVTTIMLWISGKISTGATILNIFLPALVSIIIPFFALSLTINGPVVYAKKSICNEVKLPENLQNIVFFLGIGFLLLISALKTITILPSYLESLVFLTIFLLCIEYTQKKQFKKRSNFLFVATIMKKVNISCILFIFGILMSVAVLQICGHLLLFSDLLKNVVSMNEPSKYYFISIIIGILSSLIDNVPLISGIIGAYDFLPIDHYFWIFLAYTAGTGGSIFIIGSVAGVAVMEMENINFIWYLKKIAWLTLIGYIAGCGVYILQQFLFK